MYIEKIEQLQILKEDGIKILRIQNQILSYLKKQILNNLKNLMNLIP